MIEYKEENGNFTLVDPTRIIRLDNGSQIICGYNNLNEIQKNILNIYQEDKPVYNSQYQRLVNRHKLDNKIVYDIENRYSSLDDAKETCKEILESNEDLRIGKWNKRAVKKIVKGQTVSQTVQDEINNIDTQFKDKEQSIDNAKTFKELFDINLIIE